MKKIYLLALALLCAIACSPMHYDPSNPGVPNLEFVEDGVYRSGQIGSDVGWDTIARIANGRQVHIVKLNFTHEGDDAPALARGWDVIYLPIQPEGDQDIWDDARGLFVEPDPAFVGLAVTELRFCHRHATTDMCLGHCTHGQDRTGLVFGEYRVKEDGWSKSRALSEMIDHHFHWEIVGLARAWEKFQ